MRWPWQYGVMNVVIFNPNSTEQLKVFYDVQMTNYMYRKTSSISRDLYQKLNLKNYQVISQS